MNDKVNDAIIKNFEQILDESGIEAVITEETELNRDMGIDSLGIVNLILGIEEELEIELDEYLLDVRNAKTIKELINIVERAYLKK